MTTPRSLLVGALFAVSVLANLSFGGLYYLKSVDVRSCRDEERYRTAERAFLMDLIPTLKPGVAKAELAQGIRSRYPGEAVDVLDHHVQWRLFRFWFDDAGRLVKVQWAS